MEEPDLDKGGSPLMHAANCGHAAAVTALIEVLTSHNSHTFLPYPALSQGISHSLCQLLILVLLYC